MEILVSRIPWKKSCLFRPTYLSIVHFSRIPAHKISESYKALGVAINSDQETVRQAFIELVKRYHPDSKSSEANPIKFQEVENAYRLLQEKFANDRYNVNEGAGEYGLYYEEKDDEDEIDRPDIKHTAPQHRQYLSYDGVGSGTPSQRYKQYSKYKAAKAIANVTDYRINKIIEEDPNSKELMKKESSRKKVKDIRTGGMDRLVEDLIQESISKGEFDNLAGKGKPLQHDTTYHPHCDFVTLKMNQVMINNGFTPMWITLQKEIREDSEELRRRLLRLRESLGPLPLKQKEEEYWDQIRTLMADETRLINKKIDYYNLLVPLLQQQQCHLSIEKECAEALKHGKAKTSLEPFQPPQVESSKEVKQGPIQKMIYSLFHRE